MTKRLLTFLCGLMVLAACSEGIDVSGFLSGTVTDNGGQYVIRFEKSGYLSLNKEILVEKYATTHADAALIKIPDKLLSTSNLDFGIKTNSLSVVITNGFS